MRRGGMVTELLFLFECTAERPTRLGPIARRLGVTVQAASHAYRALHARGLVEFRGGHYLPTIRGVEFLHRALGELRTDVDGRLARLHIVRTARAVARAPIPAGARVSLEMRDGILSARPGSRGASRGRAAASAAAGGLLEVVDLEGIVPIERARVRLLTLDPSTVADPSLPPALAEELDEAPEGLLAAQGLEAFHILRRATDRPIIRFGVGPASLEASRVGVPATVVLLEGELPRLLEEFTAPDPARVEVRAVRPLGARTRSARRRGGRRERLGQLPK